MIKIKIKYLNFISVEILILIFKVYESRRVSDAPICRTPLVPLASFKVWPNEKYFPSKSERLRYWVGRTVKDSPLHIIKVDYLVAKCLIQILLFCGLEKTGDLSLLSERVNNASNRCLPGKHELIMIPLSDCVKSNWPLKKAVPWHVQIVSPTATSYWWVVSTIVHLRQISGTSHSFDDGGNVSIEGEEQCA